MDICGYCGYAIGDNEAFCEKTIGDKEELCKNCQGNHWIRPEDFDNPDMNEHIEEACKNLEDTREGLRKACLSDLRNTPATMTNLEVAIDNLDDSMRKSFLRTESLLVTGQRMTTLLASVRKHGCLTHDEDNEAGELIARWNKEFKCKS